jgi:cyclohexanone monooxygenase
MQTLHGFSTRDFPNWFYIGISQNALSVNMTAMFDEQARHISYIIAETMRRGGATVEPTQEGQDGWVRLIASMQIAGSTFFESCTPGYYNNEGQPSARAAQNGFYGGGSVAFIQLLENWRAAGDLSGLELS